MFGWHPSVSHNENKKAKRGRKHKARSRREFAKRMRELEGFLDTLQLDSQSKIKKTEFNNNQRENFFSHLKSQRQSKINSLRGMFFDRELPPDDASVEVEESKIIDCFQNLNYKL